MGVFDRADEGSEEAQAYRAEPDTEAQRRRFIHAPEQSGGDIRTAPRSLRTPLVTEHPTDPSLVRALFLWQSESGEDPTGVYLWVNRLTDKRHVDRGMMRRRSGGLWSLELTVPRDVLVTYRLLPLQMSERGRPQVPPPRELLRHARIDPHNALATAGSPFGSVLAGPDASSLDAWTAPPAASSTVMDSTTRAGSAPARYRLTVPRDAPPEALLIVFDADVWLDRFRLPDLLAASGRRCAVLGIDSPTDPVARLGFLGAHDELCPVIAVEALAAAHRRIGAPDRVTIAGQSLGGLAALAFAAQHADLVDEVLAYSPSVWWRPGLSGRPVDVAERDEWIHDRIAACPPGLVSIRLASGAFEEELTPGVAALAITARDAGHVVEHSVYSGGHDEAQWAALLLTHLQGGA